MLQRETAPGMDRPERLQAQGFETIMKNFLRALRHALPYRQRLALSIFCALCAAAFWACNFSSIYPVLILLQYKQSPHDWISKKIEENQKIVAEYQEQIKIKSVELEERKREQEQNGSNGFLEQRIRDLNGALSKLESKLSPVRFRLWLLLNGQKFVNKFVPQDCFLALAWVIVLVMLGVIIKCCFEFAQESLVGSIVNLSLFDLRNRFYRNAIHLDVDQFGEQGSSELMARFTNDMESLGAGIKTLFGKVVAEPLKALGCVLLACYFISWQLTLMFLILVPIAAFILARVGRIMKRATRRLLERMSSIYKILQESFQGIRVVKAFTMEPYERRRFRVATRDYYRRAMLVVNIDALADPMIEILAVAAVGAALMVGAHLVLHESTHLFGMRMTEQPMEAAELLLLYGWLAAIADPVRKLSSVFARIQSACAASDRIFDFIDRRPRVKTNSDGPRLRRHFAEPVAGAPGLSSDYIEFRDVCFSYQPGHPILYDIHLGVRAGETIALVGANGSGKSTLLGLIPRFYDPDHGSVFIDGHDLRRVNLRSLRQQVGIVTQDTILFDDTIYNNIAYGSRRAKPEQIEEAAQRAFAHEFILAQPKGYQTRIGEIGSKLSGGQRQRLALARVILRDPSILILDEFTSAADTESEALINRAMKEFMVGRTTFVITHRLHTLEIADRIVVLEKGRIAAVGTHTDLLAGCPAYKRLQEAYNHKRLCA